MSILDYIEKIKRENEGPRITTQEPRNMYSDGQLVTPSVDGSRPGYQGPKKKGKIFTIKEAKKINSELPDNIYENIQDDQIWGFNKVFLDDDILSFGKELDDWVIQNILFKVLYPAEFHGQSAVEASFQLSDLFHEKEKDIKEIIIETHEPALRIISNKKELNNSSDRDHSLEYMVSAALIFKDLNSETYSDNFHGLNKVNSLRKKRRFAPWLKKDKVEDLDAVKKYYGYSNEKAQQALRILTKDQIEYIKGKLNTGGMV